MTKGQPRFKINDIIQAYAKCNLVTNITWDEDGRVLYWLLDDDGLSWYAYDDTLFGIKIGEKHEK